MGTHSQPDVAVDTPSAAVFLKLLDLVADPQQACVVVAEEVRRLSSARCVVLLHTRPDGSTEIAAYPEDQRALIEQPGIAAFFNQVPDMVGPAIWHPAEAPPDVAQLFHVAQHANCLIVPLIAGESHLGALVLFDFNRQYNISLIGSLERLARLLALILGNAAE